MMKTRSDGIVPGYNIETVVDAESHMIALMEVTQQQNDVGMLSVMTDKVMDEYGTYPKKASTDAGFYDPVDVKKTEVNTEAFVSIPKTKRDLDPITFTYDKDRDEYKCSEGRVLSLLSKGVMKRNRLTDAYKSKDCSGCPMKDKCTSSKTGRTYYRYYDESEVNCFKLKMKQEESRHLLSLRRTIAEHPFGTLKLLMGKIPILLRGREKVQIEFNIYATVYNLKRLIHLEDVQSLLQRLEGFTWNCLKAA
jgi:hypothetical protein